MAQKAVLVLGCWEDLANSGLEADRRAIEAHQVTSKLVSMGKILEAQNDRMEQLVEADPEDIEPEIARLEPHSSYPVIKIGVIPSLRCLQAVREVLQGRPQATVIVDAEAIFRAGPPADQNLTAGIVSDLFPRIDIIFATVPEAKALLIEAGSPRDHPRGLGEVRSMADALRRLGPKNVVIKTEMFDVADGWTTLHYVMCGASCGQSGTMMDRHYFPNPKGFVGASYSIPAATAAHVAQGSSAADAVSAGFRFAQKMLKEGEYFV